MIKIIKVSVIVPIYNAEKYLSRCIESIQMQKLKEIEIILINDGSTDNSLEICKKYAKDDNRIKIIDKSNEGVSTARNIGIETAIGEYIGFVDSDDWIQYDMYSSMYETVSKTQSYICMCNYYSEQSDNIIPISLNLGSKQLNKNEIVNCLILNMIGPKNLNNNSSTIMGSVWRLIINRKFILQNQLRFPLNIPIMEDLLFCINALLKCNHVAIDNGFYYYYCNNPTSAIRSHNKEIINIHKMVYDELEQIIKKEGIFTVAELQMNIRYLDLCINSIGFEICGSNNKAMKQKISAINEICGDDKLRQILKNINTKGYSFKKKILLFFIKHKFSLFLYIYYSLVRKLLE